MSHFSSVVSPTKKNQVVRKIAVFGFLALGALACKSERAAKFDAAAQAVCACKDAACAKKAGTAFVDLYNGLEKNIDWQSAQGKKDSAAITAAGKVEVNCLDKLSPQSEANAFCTADPKGKASTAGCTACCRDQGRFFNYWADPLAAGIVGALGGPKGKGCGCK
ncbi:MAG: hypothetical protein U0174_27360 [Polyangiaceae bacterium]